MGGDYAPFLTSFRRRLQTIGIVWYLFSFVLCAPLCVLSFIYMLFFTRFWPLMVLYVIYYFYDWYTPERGGKPWWFIKDLTLWKWMADYFPMFAHKTVELDPNKNYILACHPHGVLCPGTFGVVNIHGMLLEELYPDFHSRLSMLNFWFKVPFFRDYVMSGGLTMVTKKALNYMLNKYKHGFLLAIIPGGAPEALEARPGNCIILIKKRFGFIKLAMTNGTPIVPCFSFGDHACWDQDDNPPGSRLRNFQEMCLKNFSMALPMFFARGIFSYSKGPLPRRGAIHFHVGIPIEVERNENPTKTQVEELHQLYMDKLQELYDEHKDKYFKPGTKLIMK